MTAGVVGVLAEALAKHDGQDENGNVYDDFYDCSCGDWHSDIRSYDERKAAHLVHVASVVAALPDIAIVQIPPLTDGDTLMPPETLMQRIKSDGAMFKVGFQAAIEQNAIAGGES